MIVRVHFHSALWHHVEFPHRSIAELHDDLCARGTVRGERLIVRSSEDRAVKHIIGREPVIVGSALLFQPATATFQEDR